jgi:hypothetical protein
MTVSPAPPYYLGQLGGDPTFAGQLLGPLLEKSVAVDAVPKLVLLARAAKALGELLGQKLADLSTEGGVLWGIPELQFR